MERPADARALGAVSQNCRVFTYVEKMKEGQNCDFCPNWFLKWFQVTWANNCFGTKIQILDIF